VSEPDGYFETPCFFPAVSETLFGVLTTPLGRARDVAVVMATGGGYLTSTHRNRLHVRLARRLAAIGYHCLRFDYHGTGDSPGTIDSFMSEQPLVDDLRGAAQWLGSARGLDRHVLVGSSLASRVVLAAAPGISGLVGFVLLAPVLRDTSHTVGWMAPGSSRLEVVEEVVAEGVVLQETEGPAGPHTVPWAEGQSGRLQVFEQPAAADEPIGAATSERFQWLIRNEIPALVVFGNDDPALDQFRGSDLAAMVENAPGIEVRVVAGQLRQFASLAVQDQVLEAILDWLK